MFDDANFHLSPCTDKKSVKLCISFSCHRPIVPLLQEQKPRFGAGLIFNL
nr:MAG TPA: hypothetical protein [Caudoviricetes sp.]